MRIIYCYQIILLNYTFTTTDKPNSKTIINNNIARQPRIREKTLGLFNELLYSVIFISIEFIQNYVFNSL